MGNRIDHSEPNTEQNVVEIMSEEGMDQDLNNSHLGPDLEIIDEVQVTSSGPTGDYTHDQTSDPGHVSRSPAEVPTTATTTTLVPPGVGVPMINPMSALTSTLANAPLQGHPFRDVLWNPYSAPWPSELVPTTPFTYRWEPAPCYWKEMANTPVFPTPTGGAGTSPASGVPPTPPRPMPPLTPAPTHMGSEQPDESSATQVMGPGPLEVPSHTADPTTVGTAPVSMLEKTTTTGEAEESTPKPSDESVDPDRAADAILPYLDPLRGPLYLEVTLLSSAASALTVASDGVHIPLRAAHSARIRPLRTLGIRTDINITFPLDAYGEVKHSGRERFLCDGVSVLHQKVPVTPHEGIIVYLHNQSIKSCGISAGEEIAQLAILQVL